MSDTEAHQPDTMDIKDEDTGMQKAEETPETASPSTAPTDKRKSPAKRATSTKQRNANRVKTIKAGPMDEMGEKRTNKRSGSSVSSPGELTSGTQKLATGSRHKRHSSTSDRPSRAKRTSQDEEMASGDESSVLVDMGPAHHRTDIEGGDVNDQHAPSRHGRRRTGCFCIHWLVDLLRVLASSWLNFALILLPFPLLLKLLKVNQGVTFILAYLSLFPLSTLLKAATSAANGNLPPSLSLYTGIIFRNTLPIMIGAFAVHSNLNRLTQGMIMGLIMHRLLFHIAIPVIINGSRIKARRFDETNMRIVSSFLYLAILMLTLPSIFQLSSSGSGALALLKISRWCGVFLAILFGLLMFYSSKTDTKFWQSSELEFVNKLDVGPVVTIFTIAFALAASAVVSWIFVFTTAWVKLNWGLTHTFIAGILLPIAINASDSIDYTKLAYAGRLKSTALDAVRGCLELCMYVAPLLIIGAWMASKSVGLDFVGLLTISGILATVNLVIALFAQKVTWFQGITMLVLYLLFSVSYFLQNE